MKLQIGKFMKTNYVHHYETNNDSRLSSSEGMKKEKNKKRKLQFDEVESPDSATFSSKSRRRRHRVVLLPKRPGTTSALPHQLMHPKRVTRVLLAVGPPVFTKGD
jgi:hypothetical protein